MTEELGAGFSQRVFQNRFLDTQESEPMIVNMSEKATSQEIDHVIERIREAGYQPHVTRGV
jgi:hypothetical protein